jgi:hypothetical protein
LEQHLQLHQHLMQLLALLLLLVEVSHSAVAPAHHQVLQLLLPLLLLAASLLELLHQQ